MSRRQEQFLTRTIAIWLVTANAMAEDSLPKPTFKLVKGQGLEVCVAYLERLKQIQFLNNDLTQGRHCH